MQAKVVLVVEDDFLIRTTLAEVLADAGFAVVEAERADLALETLEQHAPAVDILFTDVTMPGSMDGLELARRVSVSQPDIAIVVASGNFIPSRSELPPGCLFLSNPTASASCRTNSGRSWSKLVRLTTDQPTYDEV